MTVVITGAEGKLGTELVAAFSHRTVFAYSHAELDITSEEAVWHAVTSHAPSLVVNAAALTDATACEGDRDGAHRINALGPWWLARACAAGGATLIHVSAEHVLGGEAPLDGSGAPRGWTEFDPTSPIGEYGRSKAAGEVLVRQTLPMHHIVRTAWLNGASGTGFVQDVLRLAREGHAIPVADGEVGSPTFARDLAAAILELSVSGRYGTVNRTNSGQCTRSEFAAAILAEAGIDAPSSVASDDPAAIPGPSPRWSVFDPGHAQGMGLSPLPPWRESLRELVQELGSAPANR